PVSLNDVVADLTPLLQRTLGEHVLLELALAPALRSIHADPGQLGQVLVNLAVNARDAMPEGGRLVIETRDISIEPDDRERPEIEPGEYVQLTVTDTGAGMAPDVLERAFDPFFTTKPAGTGTGLGLAGVYGIVVGAGGHAALYSEPGHGTTFRARFPALCKPAAAPGPAEPAEPPRAPRESTILLVEDQAPLRAITTRILERAGYRVIGAASGPEALELAETAPSLDLVLTDVVMPEMLGQRLAELLRETRPQLRVVFASGFARPALEQAGRVLDGPLLQKPFSSQELLALIAGELESQ
ncbi:MAG: ATP-binding protein, partial [Solirubrobacteraceae bacterium]